MTTSSGKTLEEAAKAVELHKIPPENFFSKLDKPSSFDGLCSGIEQKTGPKSKEAKELCIKLIRHLDKLGQVGNSESNNYCSYISYWFYEQISEIQTNKSAKIADVPFFDDIIFAWKIINNGKLKNKCNPENIKDVKLDELKNRIFSYIYFKNLDKIHNISTSKKEDDCTKYLTYLESFKSLHEKYKAAQCVSLLFWSSLDTDYFFCNPKYKLIPLISELQKCKKGDKPDPKTVLPSQAGAKGDSGAAPAKDQKVSGGTTELKAPVAVASSSSSSTVVTTSPAVTTPKAATLSTPATTTSTVAAAKPVTATTTVTATQPATATTTVTATQPATTTTSTASIASATKTVTATNTGTTTSTRYSGNQGKPSIWSGLSGLFSSPRSSSLPRKSALAAQTSTSTSSTRTTARPVPTTSTPSVRGSTVTVTTNTASAAGSISSTGQVGRGGLTHPLAAEVVPGKTLSPLSQGSPGYALNPVSSYNSNTGGDTNVATIADVPSTSETLYDKLDSNTVKNMIMAAAVLGIIFFLFYYNRSSRIESSIKPKKRKKKPFEHNYYEEYEKELAKYESENESLDSLEDRYYLTYQPDQDSYY
ncbi:PIR protein [Plasmodium vivax]|uniref:VIR protein n=1 Tax=Plasmodium vivax TaxID=5855 RepID=A0A564ZU56_PLAVI|nr:PIR protein [Plasmodium vivax]